MDVDEDAFNTIADGDGSVFEGSIQLTVAGDLSLGENFMFSLAGGDNSRFSGDITVRIDPSCPPLTPHCPACSLCALLLPSALAVKQLCTQSMRHTYCCCLVHAGGGGGKDEYWE